MKTLNKMLAGVFALAMASSASAMLVYDTQEPGVFWRMVIHIPSPMI